MREPRTVKPTLKHVVLAFVAGLIVLCGGQAPAQAHAALTKATPAAGTIVQEAPKQVVLTFSEPVAPVNDKIQVIGPDGKRADTGKPEANGAVLTIRLKDNLVRGTYLVSFRVISADSHPVPGGYTFSYGQTSTAPTQALPEEVDNTVRNLIGVAKYVGYVGLTLLVGAVFVQTLLWPARLSRRAPVKLMWAGFGLVTLSTLASIYLQVPYTNGTGLFEVDGSAFSDVMASRYGIALLVRLAVLAVAAIMVRPLIQGTSTVVDRVLVVILAGIGAMTWPLTGHPAGSPVPAVSVVTDALHLAGISVWLGGLVMLVTFLLRPARPTIARPELSLAGGQALGAESESPETLAEASTANGEGGAHQTLPARSNAAGSASEVREALPEEASTATVASEVREALPEEVNSAEGEAGSGDGEVAAGEERESQAVSAGTAGGGANEREVAAILPVWSRWAGVAIAVVVLAGVVSALIEVATLTALVETTYGRLLIAKVALVAVILGAAVLARRSVHSGQAPRVRKFAAIEVTTAAVVLAVTAALTQTTPARTAEAIAKTPPVQAVYTSTLDSSLFKLTVEVDPGKVGNNLVHLYAYDKNGQPLKVVEWKVTAALPSAGVEPIEVPMLKLTDNHVTGSLTLPTPGDWQLRFTLRISDFDQDTVTATVPVK